MPLCKLHKLNMVLVLTVSLAPSPHVATCCFPVCFLQLVLTHPCGVGCCFVRQRHLSMVHVFYGPSLVNVWRSLAHFAILFVQVGLSLVHPGNAGHAFCIVVPLPPSAYILPQCFSVLLPLLQTLHSMHVVKWVELTSAICLCFLEFLTCIWFSPCKATFGVLKYQAHP